MSSKNASCSVAHYDTMQHINCVHCAVAIDTWPVFMYNTHYSGTYLHLLNKRLNLTAWNAILPQLSNGIKLSWSPSSILKYTSTSIDTNTDTERVDRFNWTYWSECCNTICWTFAISRLTSNRQCESVWAYKGNWFRGEWKSLATHVHSVKDFNYMVCLCIAISLSLCHIFLW